MTPAAERASPFSEEDVERAVREYCFSGVKRMRLAGDGPFCYCGSADECEGATYEACAAERLEDMRAALAVLAPRLATAERQRDAAEYRLLIKEDALQESEFARVAAETRAEAAQAQLAAFAPVVAALRELLDATLTDTLLKESAARRQAARDRARSALEAYERAASFDKGSGGRG